MDLQANATKHTGRCHCGNVHFEVMVDPNSGARCNCHICTKLSSQTGVVKPAMFTVTSNEAEFASYTRFPEIGTRYFCKNCHVFCFSRGHLAELGGDFVSVNLNVLDGFDPSLVNVMYWDGRHDNWAAGPRPTPWAI